MADLLQSPLHDRHVALGAKFAEFGGWSMPLEYPTGVVKEHTADHVKSRFSPAQSGWAAVCYGLIRHPEFHLY